MTKVLPIDGLHSISYFKKFGTPCALGRIALAKSEFGDDNPDYAIYRRKPTKKGEVLVKLDFYTPADPKSAEQLIRRDLMRRAVSAWHVLGEGSKFGYNQAGKQQNTRGFAVFIKEFFKDYRNFGLGFVHFGNTLCGKDSVK